MADIDYGSILKRSWDLTKRTKWLWIYGLALSAFAGTGNLRLGNLFSSSNSKLPKQVPKDLPQKTAQVLGQNTDIIKDWFTQVPISTWIKLGVGITLILFAWMMIAWVIKSWAKGALIAGLDMADQEQEVNLVNTSPKGIAAIKNLMIFDLISIGLVLGSTLVLVILVGTGILLFSFSKSLQIIWLIFSLPTGILSGIILLVIFTMVAIYADRLIVLYQYAPWPAWKKGLSLSKGNLIPTAVMGIINQAIGCTVGCLSVIVLLIIIGIPTIILIFSFYDLKKGFHLPSLPIIIGTGLGFILLILLFIYLNYLVNAIFTVFSFSNWNLFFKQVITQIEQNNLAKTKT